MLAFRFADSHAGVPEEAALVPDAAEPELVAAEPPDDAEVPDDAEPSAVAEVPDDAEVALALPGPAGEAADDVDDAAQPAVRTAAASRGMASSLFFTRSPVMDPVTH
jgi:hypothetical protein